MRSIFTRAFHVIRYLNHSAMQRIDNQLIHLLENADDGQIHQAAVSLLARARLGTLLIPEGLSGRAQRWEGAEVESGCPLRVIYIGEQRAYRNNSPQYLHHLLFRPGEFTTTELGGCSMLASGALASRLAGQADLVMIERSPLLNWRPRSGPWAVTPTMIRMAYRLPKGATWEQVEQGLRGQRRNIRLIHRQGFTFSTSRSEEDFEFFYDRMHVPMLRERHAGYEVLDTKAGMLERFRQSGMLMLVSIPGAVPGNLPVAGKVVQRYGSLIFGIANGTLDGDPCWHDQGALSALNYFSFRWCVEQGIRHYDFGYSPPFTSNGIYQYKLRWGIQPVPDPWRLRDWLIWAPDSSPVATSWLRAHPLAAPTAGNLEVIQA